MDKFTIENLDLYYGDFKALKNINLNISPNEITAFIGPSGCGKSTLLKSLNRMNDLVEGCRINGKVLLDGQDIYGNMDINLLIDDTYLDPISGFPGYKSYCCRLEKKEETHE